MLFEDSTALGGGIISLRGDYGSSWQGDVLIKNSTWKVSDPLQYAIIYGENNENHNFSYTCYMPTTVTVDGLHIDDSNAAAKYSGCYIFARMNSQYSAKAEGKYPYVKTEKVILKNITVDSGKKLKLGMLPAFIKGVEVVEE